MRAMALGGLQLEDLPDEERDRRGLKRDKLALVAKHVGQYGPHATANRAGFQKDDVLIELAGMSARLTESEIIGRLLKDLKPGDQAKATVLRGAARIELVLRMQ